MRTNQLKKSLNSKQNRPKVSVIIPVYNVERYLTECLDSVINQTLSDIEIICVNDASPDNSHIVLNKYSTIDSRIKIITHKTNKGLGPARNTGVSYAAAPYIAFVDSDDYIDPTMMEVLYELILANKAELAWCGIAKVSETGRLIDAGQIPAGIWSTSDVLSGEKFYPSIQVVCNKLFCREYIKAVKQLPILIEDEPTIAEYLNFCKTIVTINKPLYLYRNSPESLSNPSSHKPLYWEQFFNDYELYFKILKRNFSQSEVWEKQVVLRLFAVLWRINSYNLLESPSWQEQEKIIVSYLKKDVIPLQRLNPVMYRYLVFIFSFDLPKNIKKELIKIGLKLSRSTWLTKTSYISFPFDTGKILWPGIKNRIRAWFGKIEVSLYMQLSLIYKFFYQKHIWLIGERNKTAEENGYYFYKFIKENYPNEKAYYIIDPACPQYRNVKEYGTILKYNGFKHRLLFFACKYYVTTHNHYCFPTSQISKKRISLPSSALNVFLDHGITYADVSEFYGKMNSNIDLFICGAAPEFDYVRKKFGYDPREVVYTGFARFDGLHDIKVKKQILLMPTWRRDLYDLKNRTKESIERVFKKSEYYKTIQSLINNNKLIELLNKYDYQLVFYPHFEIQRYLKYFSINNSRVLIASKEDYSVQKLLKESALLIVDTSSVNFDFAYMFKPLIYYFFDRDYFIKNHLKPGYFNHTDMGFGEVIEQENELIELIGEYLKGKCKIKPIYKNRAESFFILHDKKNCERIYNSIINL